MYKNIILVAVVLLSLKSVHACLLTMPASDGRPPFFEQKLSANSWQGLGVVWLVQISQQLNCEPKLVELPWGRALRMLQKGQLDLMTNLSKTKDRELYLDFIGPHHIEKLMLLLSNAENPITRLEDISQLKGQIAILANGFYGEEFHRLYQNNPEFRRRIVAVSSSKIMKMMLNTQRVSGLIEDERVIQHWQIQHDVFATEFHPVLTVNASPVYIALSKKALSQLKRDQIRSWWDNQTKLTLVQNKAGPIASQQ